MDENRIVVALAVLLGLAVLLHLATRAVGRWWRRLQARRRHARAQRGERTAERLLDRMGYAICARQAATTWTVACDDQVHEVPLRADLIVERDGRRFVAEVKTGRVAPRLGTAATRRQLLEYRVAYDVDGVLLVDAEAGRVMHVDFGLPGSARPAATWPRVLWALCAGAAAGLVAGHWLARL